MNIIGEFWPKTAKMFPFYQYDRIKLWLTRLAHSISIKYISEANADNEKKYL